MQRLEPHELRNLGEDIGRGIVKEIIKDSHHCLIETIPFNIGRGMISFLTNGWLLTIKEDIPREIGKGIAYELNKYKELRRNTKT